MNLDLRTYIFFGFRWIIPFNSPVACTCIYRFRCLGGRFAIKEFGGEKTSIIEEEGEEEGRK